METLHHINEIIECCQSPWGQALSGNKSQNLIFVHQTTRLMRPDPIAGAEGEGREWRSKFEGGDAISVHFHLH